jgi:hypothetical protein
MYQFWKVFSNIHLLLINLKVVFVNTVRWDLIFAPETWLSQCQSLNRAWFPLLIWNQCGPFILHSENVFLAPDRWFKSQTRPLAVLGVKLLFSGNSFHPGNLPGVMCTLPRATCADRSLNQWSSLQPSFLQRGDRERSYPLPVVPHIRLGTWGLGAAPASPAVLRELVTMATACFGHC